MSEPARAGHLSRSPSAGHRGSKSDRTKAIAVQSNPPATEFRSLYDRYFDDIARYCLRRLSRDDAHDAVADVFLVAWRRIEDMPSGDAALPWLYGVARNVVRNAKRSGRRSRRLTAELSSDATQPTLSAEVHVVHRAEYDAVLSALGRLRPADREVIRLRAQEGLTVPEIALVLGCSNEAAKKRVARALRRLRRTASVDEAKSLQSIPRATNEGGDR